MSFAKTTLKDHHSWEEFSPSKYIHIYRYQLGMSNG